MKLLLTNDELHEVRGGTQVFISDLAIALQERGHTVAVYAWLRGSVSAALEAQGVAVLESPQACAFVPEVIHGQHHLATMTALCAFPSAPAIYHCHGYGPWQERPPRHPRIARYVGMAEAMRHWLAVEAGRPQEDICILPNSVHLGRFRNVRQLCQRPRRALLYGNAFIPAHHVSRIQQACERAGTHLDKLGAPFGNAITAPEDVLPEYDLVFAIGRSALEAMACGCAVMPCSVRGCGPIINPESLEAWGRRNFTVPGDIFPMEVKRVEKEIRSFDPGKASEVTRRVRARYSFDGTCTQLEALYTEVLATWTTAPPPDALAENRAISSYLATLGPLIKGAEGRVKQLREQAQTSRGRVAKLKLRLQEEQRRWKQLTQRMPSFLKRWWLREP
ncbi:hypothetical protein DES53_10581 [Roseimicrobium gellanilyticum]|uniref:Glycosyltransferase involved in cell wall biosynthesis n=1 Tax=Roseimicrobium gellanilyticum TaxID=748857 RepID=A0A366HMX9_9BACT|nr:hypothetical protein [Roseimicrobium gellanilyticum]RBP43682.1 hypothetical protein DES53_10581 [Roseimicrobium gellanilyticum]